MRYITKTIGFIVLHKQTTGFDRLLRRLIFCQGDKYMYMHVSTCTWFEPGLKFITSAVFIFLLTYTLKRD